MNTVRALSESSVVKNDVLTTVDAIFVMRQESSMGKWEL